MAPTENPGAEPLDPNASTPPVMVHVVAPATLPEGYTFEAQIGGNVKRTFKVEVPPGGVKEGETFLAPLPDNFDGPRLQAPTGQWKDGLFDFCSLGPLHSHLWCAICCSQIAMAHVMMRLRLDWLGLPGPEVATKNTFKVIVALVFSYIIYSVCLDAVYQSGGASGTVSFLMAVGSISFSLWCIFSMCKTRESLREKFSIPEEHCIGCEDLCCSIFCNCCAIAQMSRHTGEHETYPGVFFTETGLPSGAPLTV